MQLDRQEENTWEYLYEVWIKSMVVKFFILFIYKETFLKGVDIELIIFFTFEVMSIFRSAEMKFFNIHIPKEDTYEVISRLAEHNFVQFIDCTKNAFYKPYYNSLKRCDEVITKINHVTKEIHKNKIDFPEVPNVEYVFEQHRQCKFA